ncbi:hypothetical protein NNC19_09675 [Clostridium sp. SHJSY1]|uniref:hypothetical protein n=1 Tax=Clostridium sp. SHJSY1 TaxID=2942483 RepID=UPI002876A75F|nr:hypothetical protein [Clostridium sp. SHJSY1]MDS0525946.1 hypothetical protein [Clostridium sp. SHJSY1]
MGKIIRNKYAMEYRKDKDLFFLKVWDVFPQEEAKNFLTDYKYETKKFDADDTSFVIDFRSLASIKPDFKPMLVKFIKLYMTLPYKYIIFLKSNSSTCNDTIKSAMKEGGMVYGKDAIFLDDMNAVNQLITMYV